MKKSLLFQGIVLLLSLSCSFFQLNGMSPQRELVVQQMPAEKSPEMISFSQAYSKEKIQGLTSPQALAFKQKLLQVPQTVIDGVIGVKNIHLFKREGERGWSKAYPPSTLPKIAEWGVDKPKVPLMQAYQEVIRFLLKHKEGLERSNPGVTIELQSSRGDPKVKENTVGIGIGDIVDDLLKIPEEVASRYLQEAKESTS